MRTRMVAMVAAHALLAAGCTSQPGEPPTSSPTGPPPQVDITASVQPAGQALRVTYRLVNREDADLYVLNRVFPENDPFRLESEPGQVYVTGRDGHTVEISKRAFDVPPNMNADAPAVVGATRLSPGEAVDETFTVPLPLVRRHPYGNAGQGVISLPDPVEAVVFCVGVVRDEPETTPGLPNELLFDHGSWTTLAQHVFCSEPTQLTP